MTELAGENDRLRSEAGEQARAGAVRNRVLRRMTAAQEAERARIARDLHDQVEQLLASLSLAALRSDVQRLVSQASRHVHQLAVRLRPTALDDLGLEAALSTLVGDWAGRTGVAAEFVGVGSDHGRLPLEVETALYRVAEDALGNVARHAGAAHVRVAVSRPEGHAEAVIEDDGVGFDVTRGGNRWLGLAGMRERVGLLGGTLEVESTPGTGTTVHARVPLPVPLVVTRL